MEQAKYAFHKPVSGFLRQIEKVVDEVMAQRSGLLAELYEHVRFSGGKMIRATLMLLLCGLNRILDDGKKRSQIVEIAAAIELLHFSSLIHDDIVDRANYRRGKKTFHSHFGDRVSVLWGDFMFINSLNLICFQKKAVREVFMNAAGEMIAAQIQEQEQAFNYRLEEKVYLDIIRGKTAALFAAACEIPAILAGLSTVERNYYRSFGLELGILFQISDDLLDIFSANSGKDCFRDLAEGKITLPYILFIKERGADALRSPQKKKLLADFHDAGILEKTGLILDEKLKKCRILPGGFPPSPFQEALTEIVEFSIDRDH